MVSVFSGIGTQNVITVFMAKKIDLVKTLTFISVIFSIIGSIALLVIFSRVDVGILAIGDILCGYGLLTKQPWSRILGLVMSFVGLCSIPIGTALGIYGMWTLFDEDAIALLNSNTQS